LSEEEKISLQAEMFPSDEVARAAESYEQSGNTLIRSIPLRSGGVATSNIEVADGLANELDLAERYDLSWLRSKKWPEASESRKSVRIADIFSGCGGLSLGAAEACRALGITPEFILSSELEEQFSEVYTKNFGPRIALNSPIEKVVDGDIGASLTSLERQFQKKVGSLDLLLGGPPCQGHSDLNNHTRRDDPKNELYLRMVRMAEIFRPDHLVIENVEGVRRDRSLVFQRAIEALDRMGYSISHGKLKAEGLGVAQRRHRVFVVASVASESGLGLIERISSSAVVKERSFSWACGDLLDIENSHVFDQTTELSPVSKKRVDWLFDNDEHDLPDDWRPDCHKFKSHTYKSVYGRLYWDRPAWTITTGFMVMGQGRFLHPLERRMITAHEAARLQFIPDFFEFGDLNRRGYAKMIGNAVPPKLSYLIVSELLR
jgi:DNA (cytosine-5)-methyltransferase 1